MTDDQQNRDNEEARWAKDWGPEISRRRKLLSAAFVIGAFLALIALAFLSVPQR
jgi:hypothetical protein